MPEHQSRIENERRTLAIISEFAVDLISMNSIEEILWHTAHNVVARIGFEDVVIYLYDSHRKRLIQKATFGNKNPYEFIILNPLALELGKGVVGKAALSQQPIIVNDTRKMPDYIVDDEERLSELAVPMVVDDQLIGVIDSEHPQANFYTQEQLDTVVTIASMVGTQISRINSVTELQKTIDKLEYSSKIQDSLFEIAELIFETNSVDEFCRRLHACIARLTFAKNFYIALQSQDKLSITLPYCVDELDDVEPDEQIMLDPVRPSITGYALMANKAILVYEKEMQAMLARKEVYILGSLPKAWLGVPFGDESQRGIVVVQSYSDDFAFTEKDKQLLSFVAKHIHNALERMQTRSELEFLALHDPLTQLPNRLLFSDRVKHAIAKSKRENTQSLAVFFLDLDRFKQVNDTHGHHVGDQLLIDVAKRIASCLRETDTLCRLGGDEFAILLENVTQQSIIERIANNIIQNVQQPICIDGIKIAISTSIGVASFDQQDLVENTLLVRADEAMYQAKILGRNQVYYYQHKQENEPTESYKIERDFVPAIENDELFLVFQPIVKLKSGLIVGAEALIRWQHPSLGFVAPDQFLPALEKSGLLHELDSYVVKKALKFVEQYQQDFTPKFRLSVNVSGASFSSEALMALLEEQFEQAPNLLKHLCIEITEQTIVDNIVNTQKSIRKMNRMGIHIALDDFGTGYSSLSYIHQFTFNTIKIDRAFIKNIEEAGNTSIVLETIVNLSNSLNIKTVAEGIETLEQFNLLQGLNCDRGQGYLMSKPVSEQEFVALLSDKCNQYILPHGVK